MAWMAWISNQLYSTSMNGSCMRPIVSNSYYVSVLQSFLIVQSVVLCVRVCAYACAFAPQLSIPLPLPRLILTLVFLTFCTATDSTCRWMLFVFRGAQLLQQQSRSIQWKHPMVPTYYLFVFFVTNQVFSAKAAHALWNGHSLLLAAQRTCTCRATLLNSQVDDLLGWQPQSRAPATVEAPSWLCVYMPSLTFFSVNVSLAPVHFDLQRSAYCSQ